MFKLQTGFRVDQYYKHTRWLIMHKIQRSVQWAFSYNPLIQNNPLKQWSGVPLGTAASAAVPFPVSVIHYDRLIVPVRLILTPPPRGVCVIQCGPICMSLVCRPFTRTRPPLSRLLLSTEKLIVFSRRSIRSSPFHFRKGFTNKSSKQISRETFSCQDR